MESLFPSLDPDVAIVVLVLLVIIFGYFTIKFLIGWKLKQLFWYLLLTTALGSLFTFGVTNYAPFFAGWGELSLQVLDYFIPYGKVLQGGFLAVGNFCLSKIIKEGVKLKLA